MEFAAIKSSLGHAEAGAGAMGILHTMHRLNQAASRALTHLRTINAHVASIVAAQAERCSISLPKQAAPGQSRTDMLMGISSFAFQVRTFFSISSDVNYLPLLQFLACGKPHR